MVNPLSQFTGRFVNFKWGIDMPVPALYDVLREDSSAPRRLKVELGTAQSGGMRVDRHI
jgi:hypothetical protein